MKHVLLFAALVLSFVVISHAQAVETFDIATFKAPKGWTRQADRNAIQFSTENKVTGTACLITLFKSIPGPGTSKENFAAAWETIVKEAANPAAAPQMFASDNKEDWKAEGGFAPFEKDGTKGVVLLFTLSGYGTMVNALVLTNTTDYEPTITAFLESVTLKKPQTASQPAPAANNNDASILGTWGKNQGAHIRYGDPVAAGIAGYSKDQYTFNANGTYTFVSKTFRMSYDKIILVIENGTYQTNGQLITIKPQKSVIQSWSKLNGGDRWGQMLTTQNRALETVTYRFTRHYFSGIDQWQLVLQADKPTERDGPFSTFTLFASAWYYSPISANNPVVELPR